MNLYVHKKINCIGLLTWIFTIIIIPITVLVYEGKLNNTERRSYMLTFKKSLWGIFFITFLKKVYTGIYMYVCFLVNTFI